jgi:hypothetical protein
MESEYGDRVAAEALGGAESTVEDCSSEASEGAASEERVRESENVTRGYKRPPDNNSHPKAIVAGRKASTLLLRGVARHLSTAALNGTSFSIESAKVAVLRPPSLFQVIGESDR